MFKSLKALWEKTPVASQEDNQQADALSANIACLEKQLADDPQNGEIQKALMLDYNRALRVYAKSQHHHQDMDSLFTRIDELRNIIRHNI